LNYLRRNPSEGVIKTIYNAMRGSSSELREACFQALWEMAASGVKLPDPAQYGLG